MPMLCDRCKTKTARFRWWVLTGGTKNATRTATQMALCLDCADRADVHVVMQICEPVEVATKAEV